MIIDYGTQEEFSVYFTNLFYQLQILFLLKNIYSLIICKNFLYIFSRVWCHNLRW